MEISAIRRQIIDKILARQDDSYRWGFDEKQARQRPAYMYYSPTFKATLWTLVMLADIKAPTDLPRIKPSMQLITGHFYDPEHGIFRLPDMCRFPIPCLNGNMLYLHHYFKTAQPEMLDRTTGFFATYQRFDDGDFKTPETFPYNANIYCYGKHTCYWGIVKLLKGISFIPRPQRTEQTQQLLENCIDFVLHHEVCFRSRHHGDEFLHQDIGKLSFPNFYKSDFLETLWLLAREEVHDRRMSRALDVLHSRMKKDGSWELERSVNTLVSIGQKDCANVFITERAGEVLGYYGS